MDNQTNSNTQDNNSTAGSVFIDEPKKDSSAETKTPEPDKPAEDTQNKELVYEPDQKNNEPISAQDEKAQSSETETTLNQNKNDSIHDIFGNKRQHEDDDFFPTRRQVGESHIEVQQYDVPINKKSSDAEKPEEKVIDHNLSGGSNLPGMDHINTNRAVAMSTTIAVFILVLGFGGGFFGYKYWPNFIKNHGVSADTITPVATPKTITEVTVSPTPSTTGTVTPAVSSDPFKDWILYSSSKYKYSIKYPDSWFNQNASNEQADTVQFTSFKPTQAGGEIQSGYKVEIVFQKSNGKLLKDWIKDDNIIGGYGTPVLTSLKIDGKDAYQQTITSNGTSTNTYVYQADKVMVISYYGAGNDYEAGKKIYQNMINSIKLL